MDFQPLQPPRGYTSLATVASSQVETEMSVVGVVVDYMSPSPTRGTDYNCSMFLQDSSLLGSHHNQTGVRVRLFQPPQHMPERVDLGDIILIRGIRWKDIAGNKCLVDSWKRAEYLFFPSTSIPDTAFRDAHVAEDYRSIEHKTLPGKVVRAPNAEEQDYIIKLREWAKKHEGWLPQPHQYSVPQQQPPQSRPPEGPGAMIRPQPPTGPALSRAAPMGLPGMSHKFVFVKDIEIGRFHDLAGEVIKIYDAGHVVDLYISDYTFNPLLFDYKDNNDTGAGRDGDPYAYTDTLKQKRKWQGPWGRHTICIALFEPHASYCRREIKEGDFARIRNARCFMKDGTPLQARLHEDKRHPDQVDIAKLSHTQDVYKAVVQLKEKYWETRDSKGKTSGSRAEKKKRKKLRKEQGEREAKEKEAAAGAEQDDMDDNPMFVEETRDKFNKKVVAANPERPFLTLTQILETPFRTYRDRQGEEQTLPFINMKCRSRVRIVDFFPLDLEDFAQCLDNPDYNDITSSYDNSTMSWDDSSLLPTRWEWSFYLLVEDARLIPGQELVQMPVLVHGRDAEFLLDLVATDLRHNLEIQDQLRRKLWTLWGNVEELKVDGQSMGTTKPANHPFECCIAEYGVWEGDERNGEYKRVHRLFQTTIRN